MAITGPDDKDASASSQARGWHTRSRTGCLTCRKRRVRCGEQRPICKNCLTLGRACEYPAAIIPLRERRAQAAALLPGEQQLWWSAQPSSLSSSTTWQIDPAAGSKDPFKTFPIKMTLRSEELLYYFHRAGDDLGMSFTDRREDCVTLATNDPDALLNTLLIAGVYFSYAPSSRQAYETTFLSQKQKVIEKVNSTIKNHRAANTAACAR